MLPYNFPSDRKFVMLAIVPAFLLILGVFWGGFHIKDSFITKKPSTIPLPADIPEASQVSAQAVKKFPPVLDPSLENFVTVQVTKLPDLSYKFDFIFSKVEPSPGPDVPTLMNQQNIFFTRSFSGNSVRGNISSMVNSLFNSEEQRPYFDEKIVTFAPNGKKMAIYLDETVSIFTIDFKEKKLSGDDVVRLVSEVQLLKTISVSDAHNLFFSGDGTELYVSFDVPGDDLSEWFLHKQNLDLQDSKLVKLPSEDGFPLSNSKGYVEIITQDQRDGKEFSAEAIFHFPDREVSMPIRPHDSYVNLLMSPDNTKFCYEGSASGYHGHQIFDLQNKSYLKGGVSYSYCERWIDNNVLLVSEEPYETRIKRSFLFDTRTKEYTLLQMTDAGFNFR